MQLESRKVNCLLELNIYTHTLRKIQQNLQLPNVLSASSNFQPEMNIQRNIKVCSILRGKGNQ